MIIRRATCAVVFVAVLACLSASWAYAQDAFSEPNPAPDPVLTKRPAAAPANPSSAGNEPITSYVAGAETIPLTVPKGTPVQVALDAEVKVRSDSQSIQG